MKDLKIAITGYGSVSALGIGQEEIWSSYLEERHYFKKKQFDFSEEWVAALAPKALAAIEEIKKDKKYLQLDPSVHYAIAASRLAVKNAGWNKDEEFGITIGSSRGATETFEKYHAEFIGNGLKQVNPLTSPSTTLGNISSWVATDLAGSGPVISHSATCSTALQSVANAAAWLQAGFSKRFIAGGSESPLSAFTIAQMKALKIYSGLTTDFPCRSMDPHKKQNTLILGEAAACFCLELSSNHADAYITGIGFGTERISHGASLSEDAFCIQKSMKMAIEGHDPGSIDVVIMHSPGTLLGDSSELKALDLVFGKNRPLITGNKWKIGHTFGASGALSLEMAMLMLKHNHFIQIPYLPVQQQNRKLNKILINAAGFGGTAFSILVENNDQN